MIEIMEAVNADAAGAASYWDAQAFLGATLI
jgi:hypothetical protein